MDLEGILMRRFIAIILSLVCFLMLVGCNTAVKDHTGTNLSNLSFEIIDYNGGYTETYIFDFENNILKSRGYLPGGEEKPEFSIIANFSEEEESKLITKLYAYGLFDIKDYYENPSIVDGGGWSLTIEYDDGTIKSSSGSNDSPTSVFDNCAKAFYDICGLGIVAHVPQEYYSPPNVSYSFCISSYSCEYETYGERADYKWNGFESKNNSIYDINKCVDFSQKFYDGEEYTLILSTQYYGRYDYYGYYDKFEKCIVTSYDYNEALTNRTIEYNGGWFERIELKLQLDKIYLVRIEFKNGDFSEYTFNTKITFGD